MVHLHHGTEKKNKKNLTLKSHVSLTKILKKIKHSKGISYGFTYLKF